MSHFLIELQTSETRQYITTIRANARNAEIAYVAYTPFRQKDEMGKLCSQLVSVTGKTIEEAIQKLAEQLKILENEYPYVANSTYV